MRRVLEIRVRYGETDTSGVVYHGDYFQYFEIGRTELMRSLGVPYREMEESGVFLSVVDAAARYLRPAHYDDRLRIETTLTEVGGARVSFRYEIYRGETDELLCTGTTRLGALDAETRRACRLPSQVRELLAAAEGCD